MVRLELEARNFAISSIGCRHPPIQHPVGNIGPARCLKPSDNYPRHPQLVSGSMCGQLPQRQCHRGDDRAWIPKQVEDDGICLAGISADPMSVASRLFPRIVAIIGRVVRLGIGHARIVVSVADMRADVFLVFVARIEFVDLGHDPFLLDRLGEAFG